MGGVYVVKYSHKHGDDIWVCATKEEAQRSIAEVISDNLSDLAEYDYEAAVEVAEAFPNIDKAIDIFNDAWAESALEPEGLEYEFKEFSNTPVDIIDTLTKKLQDEYKENSDEEDSVETD